jgi:hypothetical protein
MTNHNDLYIVILSSSDLNRAKYLEKLFNLKYRDGQR